MQTDPQSSRGSQSDTRIHEGNAGTTVRFHLKPAEKAQCCQLSPGREGEAGCVWSGPEAARPEAHGGQGGAGLATTGG